MMLVDVTQTSNATQMTKKFKDKILLNEIDWMMFHDMTWTDACEDVDQVELDARLMRLLTSSWLDQRVLKA
jgi:hypothetical protein